MTARDRDRPRRAVLEGLGWSLVRVWSTEWVRDREKQVRRIFAALEAARNPQRKAPSLDVELEPMAPCWRALVEARRVRFDRIGPRSKRSARRSSAPSSSLGSMPMDDLVAATGRRLGFKGPGRRSASV